MKSRGWLVLALAGTLFAQAGGLIVQVVPEDPPR
jgi:hypothetical protein